MRIFVIGSGGREHALVWKINQSPLVEKIYCAPGNPGIAQLAECVKLDVDDVRGLADFAGKNGIDLTVVGPEAPLMAGVVDEFMARGLRIFGPTQAAAAIEGSKVFAKDLMQKYGLPTARYATFTDEAEAVAYIRRIGAPVVVKADGLAAGKGVIVAMDESAAIEAVHTIMGEKAFGAAGDQVVIEEFLEGEEVSLLAFTDGIAVRPMVPAQDHKRIYDGDRGPNTGGMGAYSPAPVLTPELLAEAVKTILEPAVAAMRREGRPYKGVLYAGLMVTAKGIKTLEFNARFGDPETQVILPRLKTDLVEVMQAVVDGKLAELTIEWDESPAVCVVIASGGYPGKIRTGSVIEGLEAAAAIPDVTVFHAGTGMKDGKIINTGGRVLGVTAKGKDVPDAIARAYQAVEKISFEGMQYRRDIGHRALARMQDK